MWKKRKWWWLKHGFVCVFLRRMHVCVSDEDRLRRREGRLSVTHFSNSEFFHFTTALRGEQPKIQWKFRNASLLMQRKSRTNLTLLCIVPVC